MTLAEKIKDAEARALNTWQIKEAARETLRRASVDHDNARLYLADLRDKIPDRCGRRVNGGRCVLTVPHSPDPCRK